MEISIKAFKYIIFILLGFYTYGLEVSSVRSEIADAPISLMRSLSGFKGRYVNHEHLKKLLDELKRYYQIKGFEYEVESKKLILSGSFSGYIQDVELVEKGLDGEDVSGLLVNEGDIYNLDSIRNSCQQVISYLNRTGFHKIKCSHSYNKKKRKLKYQVYSASFEKLDEVIIDGASTKVNDFVKSELEEIIGLRLKRNNISDRLEEIRSELFSGGHYALRIDGQYSKKRGKAQLQVKIIEDEMFIFRIADNIKFKMELKRFLQSEVASKGLRITISNLKEGVSNFFENRGHRNIDFSIREKEYFRGDLKVRDIQLKFERFEKFRIDKVSFGGGNTFSDNELRKLFFDEADDLAISSYYDPLYYPRFINKLKKKYYENGFLTVSIKEPVLILENNLNVLIFNIIEGSQTKIKTIKIDGVSTAIREEVIKQQQWEVGGSFNPSGFRSVFLNIEKYLHDHGYLNAKIIDSSPEKVLKYSNKNRDVDIQIQIETGVQYRFNSYVLLGNTKTRSRFITDKIPYEPGDVIKKSSLDNFIASLRSLDLFQKVNVSFIEINDNLRDLVIEVIEKKYGIFEIAPGFRSDLGFKLSTRIGYENLSGVRRSVNLNGQVNRRVTNSALEFNRPGVDKIFNEYSVRLDYSELDLFDTNFSYNLGVNYFSKRFFSFDARSASIENLFVRTFNKNISIGLKHHLDRISQRNSLDSDDIGEFQIGSLTPNIHFDYRNNRAFSTKGWDADLSLEYAHPVLGSDSDINFSKFLLNNRYYFSLSSKRSLAIGFNFGMQINHDRSKRIPSVKLFRFSGRDILRGFSNPEMNYINDQDLDVYRLDVLDRLFLLGFKIEPRYRVTDNFILGIFLDAGKIDTNLDKPLSLSSSVGLSFKYLTPVGTINFDYGVKLHRRDIGGEQEDVGRLHVSIGSF